MILERRIWGGFGCHEPQGWWKKDTFSCQQNLFAKVLPQGTSTQGGESSSMGAFQEAMGDIFGRIVNIAKLNRTMLCGVKPLQCE